MLRIQNTGLDLNVSSNSRTSDFSMTIDPVVTGQVIDLGFANNKGVSKMATLTIGSVKKHEVDGQFGPYDSLDEVTVEVSIKELDDAALAQEVEKFSITLKGLESRDLKSLEV